MATEMATLNRDLLILTALGLEGASYGDLGSGLIDHSQKMTTAAMQIADMKV